MSKDGGPAFPTYRNEEVSSLENAREFVTVHYHGMSLRDWFAGMALQGTLAHGPIEREADPSITGKVRHCYRLADAMLKEREKEEP